MNITKRTKILVIGAAVAVAGGLTTNAFTAGGLGYTPVADNFIGGSEKVTIDGAIITNVSYDLVAATDFIDSVTVNMTGSVDGRALQVVFNQSSGVAQPIYTCQPIASIGGNVYQSVCTPFDALLKADANLVVTVDFTVEQ